MPGRIVAQFRVQGFGQRHQDGGADHRPPDRGDAAEQRHHHRLRRDQHAEHRIRRHHQQHAGIEAAGRRGDHARHDQRAHLPQPGVDAGGLGRQFVLPDRQQGEAEAGVFHQHADEHAGDQQADGDQRVVVRVGELQERRRVFPMHRQRHFLEAEVLQEVQDRQRIGEHRQREVMAAQAERRQADQDRGAPRRRPCPAGCRARASGSSRPAPASRCRRRCRRTTRGRTTTARHSRTGCSTTRRTSPRSAPASGSAGSSCW